MSYAKPRFGWQRRPFPYLDPSYAPSPELIDAICREFDIPGEELRDALVQTATYAAQAYRTHQANADRAPTAAESRAAIDAITRSTVKLLKQVESLDDKTWRALSVAAHELTDRNVFGGATELQDIGALQRTEPDSLDATFLTLADVMPALKLLGLYAAEAKRRAGTAPPGPKPNLALRHWCAVMARYWTRDLGREFTYDSYQGEGITESYRFLKHLLSELDPDALRALPGVAAETRTTLRPTGFT